MMLMRLKAICSFGVLLIGIGLSLGESKVRPPNVVLISADNLGYGGLAGPKTSVKPMISPRQTDPWSRNWNKSLMNGLLVGAPGRSITHLRDRESPPAWRVWVGSANGWRRHKLHSPS